MLLVGSDRCSFCIVVAHVYDVDVDVDFDDDDDKVVQRLCFERFFFWFSLQIRTRSMMRENRTTITGEMVEGGTSCQKCQDRL